jgi:hypothetical protein
VVATPWWPLVSSEGRAVDNILNYFICLFVFLFYFIKIFLIF